ncbi:MAG TPA: hypothetical protein VH374_04800 [Polyangia bacterium]|nr:hypothetical protein [Polyangia bacterium]
MNDNSIDRPSDTKPLSPGWAALAAMWMLVMVLGFLLGITKRLWLLLFR